MRPADAPRRRVLVIGGIHGNEPVTPPAVRGLLEAQIAPDVEVWLVPSANPDGSAAGMRCNANGVDLNRNFSWGWRRGDGGPAPLSFWTGGDALLNSPPPLAQHITGLPGVTGVAATGDLDDDGFLDVAVSAFGANSGQGVVYVLH